MEGRVGLIKVKPVWLLANVTWKLSFYSHIVFGGLSLLIGWTQFSAKLRAKNMEIHRLIGKVYVIAALLSSISGFYIALFADGGFWTALGFSCLAIIWLATTLIAYISIRGRQLITHQILMIYSYAACFAAVTLRLWLPILIITIGNYGTAYQVVAWLCWVPNLLVAYLITKNDRRFKV